VTTIASVALSDSVDGWRDAGFTVSASGRFQVGTVVLDISDGDGGLQSWTLAGAPDETVSSVDGVPTLHGDPSGDPAGSHPLGVSRIDHVVIVTGDTDRTAAAVTRSLGLPLKRLREGPAGDGREARQAFFRMGEVILEIGGPPVPRPDAGPAQLWGLAFWVDDLDAAFAVAGPSRMSVPKPAVQGGRIAALRGLRVPIALLGP
jgi:catechol 2,3-dioxygenase-like lactoylglutathione lyase family enzyme